MGLVFATCALIWMDLYSPSPHTTPTQWERETGSEIRFGSRKACLCEREFATLSAAKRVWEREHQWVSAKTCEGLVPKLRVHTLILAPPVEA